MRILPSLPIAALAALTALPAFADGTRYYPMPTNANYCPAGLQPVSIDGTTSCGRPNTNVSWYYMKRHPVQRAHYSRYYCPEGTKGCS